MSATPKPVRESGGRQNKRIGKTRFALLMEDENYDWLDRLSRARRLSIAAVLNELIRKFRSVPRGVEAP